MIDNYAEAMALVRKMEAHLPISARPTKAFVHSMRENGMTVSPNQPLQVESVLYMGDEGGIGCAVEPPGRKGTAVVTSLTHIRVDANHPLAKEIRAYQVERTRKLARTDRRRTPTQFTIKPREKRKRRKRR